jgi:hypothetical protein
MLMLVKLTMTVKKLRQLYQLNKLPFSITDFFSILAVTKFSTLYIRDFGQNSSLSGKLS